MGADFLVFFNVSQFGSESLTATSNQLTLGAPGSTVIISSTSPTSPRVYTIPDAGGNYNFVLVSNTGVAGQLLTATSAYGASWQAPATVTSVGLALPASVFSISGSPVTGMGTLTGAFMVQSANTIFAGPISGIATTPTFRTQVLADLPQLTNGQLYIGSTGTSVVAGTIVSDFFSFSIIMLFSPQRVALQIK